MITLAIMANVIYALIVFCVYLVLRRGGFAYPKTFAIIVFVIASGITMFLLLSVHDV